MRGFFLIFGFHCAYGVDFAKSFSIFMAFKFVRPMAFKIIISFSVLGFPETFLNMNFFCGVRRNEKWINILRTIQP